MTPAKRETMEELNPWARWGIALSARDGKPAITETGLWFLELTHPGAVERDGGEIYLHLDRTWRVVPQQDRAWCALEPAPFRARPAGAGTP